MDWGTNYSVLLMVHGGGGAYNYGGTDGVGGLILGGPIIM